jgi:hypothetical protein
MQRIIIRNNRIPNKVKPRVFDALVDKGEVYFEVKNGKVSEKISLTDVLDQIDRALVGTNGNVNSE